MHVYLLSGKFSAEIPDVVLSDGCVPMMGNQTAMSETSDGLELPITLEPAVWYKVLVLDSLSIDCSKKAIFWNSTSTPFNGTATDSTGRRSHIKRLSEPMYVGGECFVYECELEDLFDGVHAFLHSYVSGKITTRQFRAAIFRQLHCCVLPSIKLCVDDMTNTVRAYNHQEKMVARANTEILKRDQQMGGLQNAMQRQREHFIDELAIAEEVDYPLRFASVLLTDVEQDLAASWKRLDELQQVVDVHKRGEVPATMLASSRAARDVHLVKYNHVLAAKGVLSDFMRHKVKSESELDAAVRCLKRPRDTPKPLANPLHAIYVEMSVRYEDGLQQLCRLADRKVLVLSVKEAIRSTLDELRSGEDTCGIDVDRTGKHRATDVLRGGTSVPREWLTLTEQISNLLEGSCPLAEACQHFMSYVVDKCAHVLYQPLSATSKYSVSYGSLSKSSQHTRCESTSSVIASSTNGTASEMMKDSHLASSLESGINSDDALGLCKSLPMVAPPINTHWQSAQSSRNRLANSWPFKRTKARKPVIPVECTLVNKETTDDDTFMLCSSSDVDNSLTIYTDWYDSASDDNDMVSNREDCLKNTILILKEDIKIHFADICRKIQLELKRLRPIHYRKIWLCYESHFYKQTMPSLSRLYEAAYASTVQTLCASLSSLSVADTGLQCSIMAHMLQDVTVRPPSNEMSMSVACSGELAGMGVLNVHLPSSVTVLYDRRSWPLCLSNDSVECGMDGLVLDDANSIITHERSARSQSRKTLRLKPEWCERMAGAAECLTNFLQESVPLLRLQNLTLCLRYISQQATELQGSLALGVCSDDLIDALVVLLCNLDSVHASLLYPHIHMLDDLMAPFFEGGPYSFSLVQFSGAFQFLQRTLALRMTDGANGNVTNSRP